MDLIEFLSQTDIVHCLKQNNLNSVYKRFMDLYLSGKISIKEVHNLTQLFIDNGIEPVKYFEDTIPKYSYSYMEDLLQIEIPNSITKIEMGAFRSCNLQKVKLSNNLEVIESGAFVDNAINEVRLPDSLYKMHATSFDSMTGLIMSEKLHQKLWISNKCIQNMNEEQIWDEFQIITVFNG